MSQKFHPSSNTIARASLIAGILLIGGALFGIGALARSQFNTRKDVVIEQPVEFSHEHHVKGLGIDCRYCHTTVEESSFAGIPPTHTCMTCHSQVWSDAPALEKVRESYRTGEPIPWVRVNDLPDFVYFDHSIHVERGVACTTCHGPVHEMPLTWRASAMDMKWCLECHRSPEKFIGPPDQVFSTAMEKPSKTEQELLAEWVDENLSKHQLTNCSVCHR